MKHQASGKTDVGKKRDHNEDAILIDTNLGLYLVADGLGGYAAGELASHMACDVIGRILNQGRATLDAYVREPHVQTRASATRLIELAIDEACREVYRASEADPEKRGMACTVALMCILGEHAIVAHVGDSRVYLARRGQVHQMTDDHSLLTEKVRLGIVTAEQAGSGKLKSAITRSVGRQESVQVESLHFELMPGDVFLLCSDGLSDYLHSGQEFLDRAGKDPEQAAAELVDFANAAGGKDNISAVVVRIDGQPDPEAFNAFAKMEVLRKLPLFEHLTFKELMSVLNIVELKTFEAGQAVLSEGTPGEELYVSVRGRFHVRKGGQFVAELKAGDFFGEMALITRTTRSADVTAFEQSVVLAIRRESFYLLLIERPVMATKLLWAFCQVLAKRLQAKGDQESDTLLLD
jgi:PPM family protein phosphatase